MDARQWKPAVAASLLVPGQPSLSAWYADPPAQGAASALLARTERAMQTQLREGAPCFQLRVLQLLCHCWLGEVLTAEYAQLLVAAAGDRERGLLELVYGQLLVSRKYRQADWHLQRGFTLVAPRLNAADYFCLVRRHELLGYLCLSDTPAPPQTLAALLTEASVVRRLRGETGRKYSCSHLDTVG